MRCHGCRRQLWPFTRQKSALTLPWAPGEAELRLPLPPRWPRSRSACRTRASTRGQGTRLRGWPLRRPRLRWSRRVFPARPPTRACAHATIPAGGVRAVAAQRRAAAGRGGGEAARDGQGQGGRQRRLSGGVPGGCAALAPGQVRSSIRAAPGTGGAGRGGEGASAGGGAGGDRRLGASGQLRRGQLVIQCTVCVRSM